MLIWRSWRVTVVMIYGVIYQAPKLSLRKMQPPDNVTLLWPNNVYACYIYVKSEQQA
jgi:hypothetical protein